MYPSNTLETNICDICDSRVKKWINLLSIWCSILVFLECNSWKKKDIQTQPKPKHHFFSKLNTSLRLWRLFTGLAHLGGFFEPSQIETGIVKVRRGYPPSKRENSKNTQNKDRISWHIFASRFWFPKKITTFKKNILWESSFFPNILWAFNNVSMNKKPFGLSLFFQLCTSSKRKASPFGAHGGCGWCGRSWKRNF